MNKQKLLELADFIENIPSNQFDMADWSDTGAKPVCLEQATSCGTACCIAGWAVLKEGYCIRRSEVFTDPTMQKNLGVADDVVTRLYNLPNTRLFYSSDWPYDLKRKLSDMGNYNRSPKLAAQIIRDYVANEGWGENL